MGDASPPAGESLARSLAGAKTPPDPNAAVARAPERMKFRRENTFAICDHSPPCRESLPKVAWITPRSLHIRCPPLLVLPAPHLHRLWVTLNPPVFRVEMQLPVHFPGDVGKLQHHNRDIADRNRGVELFAFADSCDEVRKVGIRHGI